MARDGPDTNPVWSPDGSRIAFQTPHVVGAPSFANHGIAVIPAAGGTIELLTASFDENPSIETWNQGGIFFSASQHTWSYLYRLDPATKTTSRIAAADAWNLERNVDIATAGSYAFRLTSDDGSRMRLDDNLIEVELVGNEYKMVQLWVDHCKFSFPVTTGEGGFYCRDHQLGVYYTYADESRLTREQLAKIQPESEEAAWLQSPFGTPNGECRSTSTPTTPEPTSPTE